MRFPEAITGSTTNRQDRATTITARKKKFDDDLSSAQNTFVQIRATQAAQLEELIAAHARVVADTAAYLVCLSAVHLRTMSIDLFFLQAKLQLPAPAVAAPAAFSAPAAAAAASSVAGGRSRHESDPDAAQELLAASIAPCALASLGRGGR